MEGTLHPTPAQLEAGLEDIRRSPRDGGRVELIVLRPADGLREEVTDAVLDPEHGLVGDNWKARGSRHTDDGAADPERQLTLMNARAAALIAGDPTRRALAGDQLFVDLDLGADNLPPGTRLRLGAAVIEISAAPHTGCAKFIARFGRDAGRWVNTGPGRELSLRGVNATVVEPGIVAVGDPVHRLA